MGHAGFKDVSTSRHMYVEAKIGNKSLIALIDTGASGLAFISKSMNDSLNLRAYPIRRPISIIGFEGNQGAQVTQRVSFTLALGRHVETLSAFVVHPCKHDLVLGLPWLEEHAPYVNWKENTITFGENCIEKNCCHFETTINYINSTSSKSSPSDTLKQTPENSQIHKKPELFDFNPPTQLNASNFLELAHQPENSKFALSLRYFELLIEDCMERLCTVQVNETIKVIPKNANPKEYLPTQYDDFLDVFDQERARALPPIFLGTTQLIFTLESSPQLCDLIQ